MCAGDLTGDVADEAAVAILGVLSHNWEATDSLTGMFAVTCPLASTRA
jgi:hypothetical protein